MTDSDIEDISEIEIDIDVEKDMTPILLEDLGMRIAYEGANRNRRFGLYKCAYCGNTFEAKIQSVNSGDKKSCGCKFNAPKHGGVKERLYRIWGGIKQRCLNPNNKDYKNYGARGITIYDEWLKDYAVFREWALGNGYSDELSIDRVDVDGNYEPNNCRWATKSVQASNTRLLNSNNKSGFRCVISCPHCEGLWLALTVFEGEVYRLHYSRDIMECVYAYDLFVLKNNLPKPTNFDLEHYISKGLIKQGEIKENE